MLVRRNAIVLFMCVELMLNAANLALVTFSRINGTLDGQIIAFFVMVVAAAEVVVGPGHHHVDLPYPTLGQRRRREPAEVLRDQDARVGVRPGHRDAEFSFWLLIAIPLASAAVLLLLGRRADKWGHLLGVASVGASRSYSA